MLPSKTEDKFIGQYCRIISLPIGPQGEKGFFQLRLTEKMEAAMFSWSVADIKQRKLFQFVDKPFLRAFGPLGNSSKAAFIRAVQGDYSVRFAKINIFQDNASGTAGLVRQICYSEAVSLSVSLSPSCAVAGIGTVTEGVTASSKVFPLASISVSGPGSGVVAVLIGADS